MLRSRLVLAAKNSTRPAGLVVSRIVRQPLQHAVRYQSDQADDQRKKALEHRNDMMRDWDARILTYEEVKPKTLSPSPGAYLIDVREPDEAIQGSIPSSVNLPLSVLPTSLHLHTKVFKTQHGFEKPLKNQEIIFYCRTGKRSATACDVAKRNGFTNVYNYEGSWVDWLTKESAKGQQSDVSSQNSPGDISIERYHELSDATMNALLEALEGLLDSLGNPNFEVEYHSGVLTLVLGEKGTYVINKQPPNKQIWLSSPFSGPKRYDYSSSDDNWRYSRDGQTLSELLNDELSHALQQTVDLGLRRKQSS